MLASGTASAQFTDDDEEPGGDPTGALVCCAIYMFAVVAGLLVWLAILIWVYNDSKGRAMENPGIWVLIVFLAGWIGLIIYLCMRPSGQKVLCPSCGKQSLRTIPFCPFCNKGKASGYGPIGQGGWDRFSGGRKCPRCGTEAPPDAKICPSCYWNL